jgi:hypothetical protein
VLLSFFVWTDIRLEATAPRILFQYTGHTIVREGVGDYEALIIGSAELPAPLMQKPIGPIAECINIEVMFHKILKICIK